MFTGLVQATGIVREAARENEGLRLCMEADRPLRRLAPGSSVSVSGVCLTLVKKVGRRMWFDAMEETIRKTTLGFLKPGGRVNLEPSLRLGDEVGGHFVFGHVDGVARIKNIEYRMKNCELTFVLPKKLMKYIVLQGSVAVDGVSLTVARVGKNDCTVSLVDFTLEHTTLKNLKKGDTVNIECDMLAKYVMNA